MTFYKENEKMYHIAVAKGDVGRYVFLPGDPGRTDLIASYLDDAKLIAHNREHKTWTGYLDGVKVSVMSTGMGCASAAIAVEELIKVGADTFLRIGTAGRVNEASKDPKVDGAICVGAVRDEGTSMQYIPVEYPAVADRKMLLALRASAKKLNRNFIEGITQSKDSFYGEVDPMSSPQYRRLMDRWEMWEKSNVVASEMESSTIFVISSIRGCRAASLMSFEDMPSTIEVAIDAFRSIIKADLEEDR